VIENPIRGKTALITGAARRIGRAIALAFADEGANVVIHYSTSEEAAGELAREIERRGARSWTVRADFADAEETASLIRRSVEVAGPIDVLVNNASIFPLERLEDLTFEGLVTNMRVNAWAPFVLSREFKREIGRGKIINLHDSRLLGFDWAHVGYILSKHVLAVLTKMTAVAYAPDITVNAVAPGLILPPAGKDESYLERLASSVPLKRHGDAADVADAVVFLAKSDFITGEVIYVDGGRHLKEYGDG